MKKAAYFADKTNPKFSDRDNYSILGDNTGNEAFISSISKIIEVDRLERRLLRGNGSDLDNYDSFITSDLIWIRQNTDAPESIKSLLDRFPDKPVVAISLGLQSNVYQPDFQLSKDMIHTLERMNERATIAVRGAYTAEILSKNGIKNFDIVGCPSVYQLPLYQKNYAPLLASKTVQSATSNFRTFYEPLKAKEEEILLYFSQNCTGFVEQTQLDFDRIKIESSENHRKIDTWLKNNRAYFFEASDWVSYCKNFDFSLGSRFHGNVMSVLAGVRALFLTTDTRTAELTEFFGVPSLPVSQFDPAKSIQEYYDMADYSKFISSFHGKISNFCVFLAKNKLGISKEYRAALDSFDFQRIGRPWAD